MKRYLVRKARGRHERVIEALTPQAAANKFGNGFRIAERPAMTCLVVAAEDGHTSLVKVGADG